MKESQTESYELKESKGSDIQADELSDAPERAKEKLTGKVLGDISMLEKIADSLSPDTDNGRSQRSKLFMMMMRAGKYAFITENGRRPPMSYTEYVGYCMDAELPCIKAWAWQCFQLIDAATRGDVDSLLKLGEGFFKGSFGEMDYPFAAFSYELAAEAGNGNAQDIISGFYRRGIGVPQSDDKADFWQKKTEGQGTREGETL